MPKLTNKYMLQVESLKGLLVRVSKADFEAATLRIVENNETRSCDIRVVAYYDAEWNCCVHHYLTC